MDTESSFPSSALESSELLKMSNGARCIDDADSVVGVDGAPNASDDQFFFSNMLRSLLPKDLANDTGKGPQGPFSESFWKIRKLDRNLPTEQTLWYSAIPWAWSPELLRRSFWDDWPLTSFSSRSQLVMHGHYNRYGPTEVLIGNPSSGKIAGRRLPHLHRKLLGGQRFRPHHMSAFTAPKKLPVRDSCNLSTATDRSKSTTDRSKPNVHYIMTNLKSIFADIHISLNTSGPRPLSTDDNRFNGSPCCHLQSMNSSNCDSVVTSAKCDCGHPAMVTQPVTQLNHNCKKFSALIGLEIVVDYVKQDNRPK